LANEVSLDHAYAILKPAKKIESNVKNPEGLRGRVLTGYQGWFRTPGDGSGMGFHHYQKNGKFEPGACTIDLWPDLTGFDEDEKFDTPFRHKNGVTAQVFSSLNPKTVNRHFEWMKEYEIDGAFVQRFGSVAAKERRSHQILKADNQKLLNCRDAAIANGRCYALMYDLSGLKDDDFERLAHDWKTLRTKMKLGVDPNDPSYLQLNGKPLVAIWGVGFGDDRDYGLTKCEDFINLLKNDPQWGGCEIMLGVPFGWREQNRDATTNKDFHRILKLADILSPWSVGRYHHVDFSSSKHVRNLEADRKWCEQNDIEYLPVVYPGFSWHNLKGTKLDTIPRRGGRFYWDQFVAVRAAGIDTAYVAMFDEIDEATAIFKVSNNPPVSDGSKFLNNEGLPSDHYLKITRKGGILLRGHVN